MYPVDDPQGVREPRPDNSYYQSGYTGLQLTVNTDFGEPAGGSRVFQWGWGPVGGSSTFDEVLTPNYLASISEIGTVTITTT
jgi:hypothetical protein